MSHRGNASSGRKRCGGGGALSTGLRRDHQLSVWRGGLLPPGIGRRLERERLEFHLDLPGGRVAEKLAIRCSQLFPGRNEVAVAEYRQVAPAHDPGLDDRLISSCRSHLDEAAVRAQRLHRGGTWNTPDRIEHNMELTATGLTDALR